VGPVGPSPFNARTTIECPEAGATTKLSVVPETVKFVVGLCATPFRKTKIFSVMYPEAIVNVVVVPSPVNANVVAENGKPVPAAPVGPVTEGPVGPNAPVGPVGPATVESAPVGPVGPVTP
jgi:hypothetical protein